MIQASEFRAKFFQFNEDPEFYLKTFEILNDLKSFVNDEKILLPVLVRRLFLQCEK